MNMLWSAPGLSDRGRVKQTKFSTYETSWSSQVNKEQEKKWKAIRNDCSNNH